MSTQLNSELPLSGLLGAKRKGPSIPEVVARRLIDDGFSGGRLDVCDELIAEDMIEHPAGAAGVKAVITYLRRAFSDFRLEIETIVVCGDTVWLRNVATGTNDGRYMGNPPTGRRFKVYVFDVLRIVDGRVVEHWGVPDRLGVLSQLGTAR